MFYEMSTRVQPSNNYARLIFSFFTSGGICLALISTLVPMYKGIVALAGAILLVVGITVYSKYLASVYYYDITKDANGTPVFVVRQIMGKRESTLCRIDMADIISVIHETSAERRNHKTPAGYLKYVYTPTLMPKATSRLIVEGQYEKAEIVIENRLYAEHLLELSRSLRGED